MNRLFHVSDLHFGAEDRGALQWFASTVEVERPDAVIVTGDITQRAKRSEFRAACEYLRQLPVPVTVEPGNHDLPYFNLFERFTTPYKRLGRVRDLVEAELDLDQCRVVPLKTTARFQLRFNWSLGNVDRKSIRSAVRHTRAADDGKLVLVASHHPLIDLAETGTKGNTRGGGDALERLAAAGADAFLTGHVHTPFHIRRKVAGREVHLVGAGTLSERIREHPPSFNEVVVADGTVTVNHHAA